MYYSMNTSVNNGAQQCYFCDSDKQGGQGDVDEPTKCGTLTNCQTDEVISFFIAECMVVYGFVRIHLLR